MQLVSVPVLDAPLSQATQLLLTHTPLTAPIEHADPFVHAAAPLSLASAPAPLSLASAPVPLSPASAPVPLSPASAPVPLSPASPPLEPLPVSAPESSPELVPVSPLESPPLELTPVSSGESGVSDESLPLLEASVSPVESAPESMAPTDDEFPPPQPAKFAATPQASRLPSANEPNEASDLRTGTPSFQSVVGDIGRSPASRIIRRPHLVGNRAVLRDCVERSGLP